MTSGLPSYSRSWDDEALTKGTHSLAAIRPAAIDRILKPYLCWLWDYLHAAYRPCSGDDCHARTLVCPVMPRG